MSTLQQANDTANKAMSSVDKTIDNMDAKVDRANAIMNTQVTTLVRTMLLTNYNRAGIKTNTGKLRGALGQVEAIVILKGKKPKISIHMPSGIGGYDNGGNFYEASAAVNYGAVHGSTEGNSKRKKNIKKKVQKNASKKKPQDTIIAEGHVLSAGKQTKAGSTEFAGGVKVTKAFGFWTLSSAQQKELQNLVLEIFNQEVFGVFGKE